MIILGSKTSPTFKKYYYANRSALGKPVRYITTSGPGYNNESASEIVVEIPVQVKHQYVETIAAHELTHIILRREGFPQLGVFEFDGIDPSTARVLNQLSNFLGEMILGPLISQRLDRAGFPIVKLNSELLMTRTEALRTERLSSERAARSNPWFKEVLPLSFYYSQVHLDTVSGESLGQFLPVIEERMLEAVELGEEILSIVKPVGYADPDSCIACFKAIGDRLRLYPLLVYDVRSKSEYRFQRP